MKTCWAFFIITFVSLLVIKIVEYYKYIKIHKKQVEELEDLIVELKNKQTILNQQVKTVQLSEKYQKMQLTIISSKIYEAIDKYLK